MSKDAANSATLDVFLVLLSTEVQYSIKLTLVKLLTSETDVLR